MRSDCPLCKAPLIAGPKKKFETLVEHVMYPNLDDDQVPERATLICPIEGCRAHDGFWSKEYGEWYGMSSVPELGEAHG